MSEIIQERWVPVPNFNNYFVSNLGRFKRITLSGEKELKGKVDRVGYRQIGFIKDGRQRWFLAHRVVACAFLAPENLQANPGTFLTVNHKNRTKTDNALDNLELVTVAQNHKHWRRHPLDKMKTVPGVNVIGA